MTPALQFVDASPQVIAGFFCQIDNDDWGKRNKLSLFKDKLQRWVIATAVSETASDDGIARDIRRWMNFIFSFGIPRFGRDFGAATDFKVVDVNKQAPSTPDASQLREQLPGPMPFLKPGPVAFVTVEFAWRGPAATMPWPVTRVIGSRLHGVNSHCPLDANVMVIATKELSDAPPRDLDDNPLGSGFLPDILPPLSGIFTALITTAIVAGLGYAYLKTRKSN